MDISNSFSWFTHSIQLSSLEHIFHHTLLYLVTPLWQVFCQLSSLTIAYPNMGFKSSSLTFMVPMSNSCITSSHHTVLWKLYSSQFHKKCIFLEMCLVCLEITYLIPNIIIYAWYGTTSGSLFENSYLSTWNMIEIFLQIMLYYIHSKH